MADRKAEPFAHVESTTLPNAAFSPDGRWVAYVAGEAAGAGVFVQPFPPTGATYQVSRTETLGVSPLWSLDGTELFYARGPGDHVVVRVTTQPGFNVGNPIAVASRGRQTRGQLAPRDYDISRDGKRFIVIVPVGQGNSSVQSIQVVLNWFEDLKQRVPTRR